jgi:ABC-type nitrate/sulfonate/bicarbonate transport system permease component
MTALDDRTVLPRTRRRPLAHPALGGTAGIVLLILLWTIASTVLPSSSIVPTPWSTVASIVHDFGAYYLPNVAATLGRAAWGYLWGNLAGLALAAVVLLIPRIEEVVVQLGVISQCLPVTAIGPIILLVWGPTVSTIFLAAMLCFFTTMIGAILGMRAAPRSTLDVVTAFGGGPIARIRVVQLLTALPAVITALKIAVPAAILGAVVGEYLGATDSGLGVALQAAQRTGTGTRVWAMSILAGLVALAGYGLVGLIGRLVTPWTRDGRSRA